MGLINRFKKSWNTFREKGESSTSYTVDYINSGPGYSYRPDRFESSYGNSNTIISSIYNRISIDVANLKIRHCKLDEKGRYKEDVDSSLNSCFTLEANLDQSYRSFLQDIVESLLQEGSVAVVPVDYDINPTRTDSYKIYTMRVGKIVQWYPKYVKVNLYNENTGRKEDVFVEKRLVAIIENPFYSIMNQPNSTLKRLTRKLSLLDTVDEITASGRMDLIIQLPYSMRSAMGQAKIKQRQKEIDEQLKDSKYGIAYIDATEHITQLNRPLENNLLKQVEYLTNTLYSQLGMTVELLNGTANEQVMLNYTNRTIKPIISTIVNEFRRKFLSKTARAQGQDIRFFASPFDLVPVNNLAEIADKFTRNEIISSNEFRQVIGLAPSDDPRADELRNSNMPYSEEIPPEMQNPEEIPQEEEEIPPGLEKIFDSLSDEELEAVSKMNEQEFEEFLKQHNVKI